MVNFFLKYKKVRGVITIFLTIIYLSVYLLIGMFVDGGRIRMAHTAVEDVQQIATENMMAQYNRGLYEYYGLFGLSGYSLDDITKDVKAQIEESIGLTVPDDSVKNFILDVSTGIGSLTDNFSIFTENDNKLVGAKDLYNKVGSDIKDSHKVFDPYGIEVVKASASSIDLSNIDVFRAQIRDEMRYTALPVIGANFIDVVNKFMSVGGSAATISTISEIISKSENSVNSKQKEYYDSLNTFSDSFHKYVEKCYEPTKALWGVLEVDTEVANAVSEAQSILTTIASIAITPVLGFARLFAHFNKDKVQNVTEESSVVEKLVYTVSTDMHLDTDDGFLKIIANKNKLYRFCNDFDNPPWPQGSRDDVEEYTDSEGNVHYRHYYGYDEDGDVSESNHRNNVITKARGRKVNYNNSIRDIIDNYSKPAIENINDSISKINICMDAINYAEGQFLNEYMQNENTLTDESKDLYKSHMETFLKQWNHLAVQRETLKNFKHDLEELNTILENATKNDIESNIVNSISNEDFVRTKTRLDRETSTIRYYRESDIAKFHGIMEKLGAESGVLKEFQNTANSDKLSTSIFDLLGTVITNKESKEKDIPKEEGLFGIIKSIEPSDLKLLYDPFKDPNLEDNSNDSKLVELEFTRNSVVDKIKEIMDTATNIVNSFAESFAGNIYDETYILSHCRDYVHTYRYRALQNEGKIDGNGNHTDGKIGDIILNPKFIKDQSSTKYLSNSQFKSIEVTPAEIEYILWGHENTIENVAIMYANIFIIRLALNYIAAATSTNSKTEINAIAASSTIFAPAIKFAAPLIYALPKSISETVDIMYNCEKVNLWNGGNDLHLWSAFTDLAGDVADKAKAAANRIKENAKKALENVKNNAGTVITIASVMVYGAPENIRRVITFLGGEILIAPFESSDIDNADSSESSSSNNDNKIKAGYSDYLLIYLFLRGIRKESQMRNLQSVIEANMKKAQDENFKLSNTYSQISVETESTIKYIFMTQSFMRKSFSNANKYDKHSLKIKTAFAY